MWSSFTEIFIVYRITFLQYVSPDLPFPLIPYWSIVFITHHLSMDVSQALHICIFTLCTANKQNSSCSILLLIPFTKMLKSKALKSSLTLSFIFNFF